MRLLGRRYTPVSTTSLASLAILAACLAKLVKCEREVRGSYRILSLGGGGGGDSKFGVDLEGVL